MVTNRKVYKIIKNLDIMGIAKTFGLLALGAGIFLSGYSCDRSQKVRLERGSFGGLNSVKLKQFGIERTLVQSPTDYNEWVVPRNKTLDSACDSAVGVGKWIYAKANEAYADNKGTANPAN